MELGFVLGCVNREDITALYTLIPLMVCDGWISERCEILPRHLLTFVTWKSAGGTVEWQMARVIFIQSARTSYDRLESARAAMTLK